jgi:acyl-CoA reductase-like NAD-dependent aldehyde dehydrogenase
VAEAPRRAPSPDPEKKKEQAPVVIAPAPPAAVAPSADSLQDLQDLKAKIATARAAMMEYSTFSQEKVDVIFKAAASAASAARIQLAVMAVEETGMGLMEDKASTLTQHVCLSWSLLAGGKPCHNACRCLRKPIPSLCH